MQPPTPPGTPSHPARLFDQGLGCLERQATAQDRPINANNHIRGKYPDLPTPAKFTLRTDVPMRPRHGFFLHEFGHRLDLLVDADRQDLETILGIRGRQLAEFRKGSDARPAPRRPEIQEDHLARVGGELLFAAVQTPPGLVCQCSAHRCMSEAVNEHRLRLGQGLGHRFAIDGYLPDERFLFDAEAQPNGMLQRPSTQVVALFRRGGTPAQPIHQCRRGEKACGGAVDGVVCVRSHLGDEIVDATGCVPRTHAVQPRENVRPVVIVRRVLQQCLRSHQCSLRRRWSNPRFDQELCGFSAMLLVGELDD